nr:glutamate mutase L [Candidatus Brocadiia bacterium]
MADYLLADIGSTFTKLCLVDACAVEIRGQAMAPTTIQTDVNTGFDEALARLPLPPANVEATLVCSSAAGGLRIAAVGLVPQLTLEAARMAALGAGGKVVRAFAYDLSPGDVSDLLELKPDIVLLSGGTDGGNTRYIIANARRLQQS